ncbi:hypothetical protein BDK51DRAFT_49854 [Blyttiomyces helicus]|uniref:Uncharacterized protein n=1 Tax=Blyttiomyces helicus TaxID=388810 RepID=A0A4P9WHH4_9FUNG|nr:hypothetical protein BDK51DRAFT_49854 [Blyttiomyces helicus]|eukprot:RKO90868.1 hypothetical protein BDK51DRAFT_49854 [Blyttiomyces helicus]
MVEEQTRSRESRARQAFGSGPSLPRWSGDLDPTSPPPRVDTPSLLLLRPPAPTPRAPWAAPPQPPSPPRPPPPTSTAAKRRSAPVTSPIPSSSRRATVVPSQPVSASLPQPSVTAGFAAPPPERTSRPRAQSLSTHIERPLALSNGAYLQSTDADGLGDVFSTPLSSPLTPHFPASYSSCAISTPPTLPPPPAGAPPKSTTQFVSSPRDAPTRSTGRPPPLVQESPFVGSPLHASAEVHFASHGGGPAPVKRALQPGPTFPASATASPSVMAHLDPRRAASRTAHASSEVSLDIDLDGQSLSPASSARSVSSSESVRDPLARQRAGSVPPASAARDIPTPVSSKSSSSPPGRAGASSSRVRAVVSPAPYVQPPNERSYRNSAKIIHGFGPHGMAPLSQLGAKKETRNRKENRPTPHGGPSLAVLRLPPANPDTHKLSLSLIFGLVQWDPELRCSRDSEAFGHDPKPRGCGGSSSSRP